MQLRNVEETFNSLQSHPADVVISSSQAASIWELFRGSQRAMPEATFDRRFEYKAFLQAAFIGLMDGSAAMSYVEALWKASIKPTASVTSIVKAMLKEALKQYFQNKIGSDPKLYDSVRVAILMANRPYFDMISNGLCLTGSD
jgi:hypothetical protein